jgi:hypothetical protein
VLNETRKTVILFNTLLKQRVISEQFHWLDFFDDLLQDGKLKPEYELDGTHLHPKYVSLIEKSINK